MKRSLVFGITFFLCLALVGCGSDSKEGLIADTVRLIDLAATEVGNIKTKVKEATDKSNDTRKKLDLADAMSAAKKLKETGEVANQINKRIEKVRQKPISAEDKKANADNERERLNTAFANLHTKRQELRVELAKAEGLDVPNAKDEVQKLRDKIRDAESPFESLQR